MLTTIVLARLVAPDEFGLVALATLALTLLGLVKDLGLGGTVIVRQDLDRTGRVEQRGVAEPGDLGGADRPTQP